MAMTVGDAENYTGLAGRFRTRMEAEFGAAYVYDQSSRKFLNSMAQGVVDEVELEGPGNATKYVSITRATIFDTTEPVIGAWTPVDISSVIPADAFAVQMMTKLYNPDTDSLMYWGPVAASSELELFVGSASNYWGSAAGIVNVGPSRTLQYLAQGDATWNFNRAFVFGYYILAADV